MQNDEPNNLPVPMDIGRQAMLIEHPVGGEIVPQRPLDGYINATKLCQQADKLFADYARLARTKAFLQELSAAMGIPIAALVQTRMGGNDQLNQGTWVHPQVAISLGQWLSPAFEVQVTKWVFDWMVGATSPYMPAHVQRYLKNKAKIPYTHFSMLNEIYLNLFAHLEDYGAIPPDNMMPDISTGLMFFGLLEAEWD